MIPLLFSFRNAKNFLCSMLGVMLLASMAMAQTATISGRVTDNNGKALIGATVQATNTETGDRSGAVTGANGAYRITNVRLTRYTVKVSYVGYKTASQTLSVSAAQDYPINFSLAEDIIKADEVVVTGVGGEAISKKKLGASIQTVSGSEIAQSGEASIVSGIAGKASNVEVTQSSGDPGAGSYIRIRGATTISLETQPLMVIDGVPIDNSTVGNNLGNSTPTGAPTFEHVQQTNRATDIDPNDIESMEILKGATAAAMYGSRAANGVILITTKKGKIGETKITVHESNSFDVVSQQPALQTTWGQGSGGRAKPSRYDVPLTGSSWGPKISLINKADINNFPLWYSNQVYDHTKDIFQTGHRYDYGLSASGGDGTTSYYFSADRTDHEGIVIENSTYERNAFNLNASHLFSEVVKVSGNVSYSRSGGDRIQMGSNLSGLLLGLYRTAPNFNNQDSVHPNGLQKSYRNQANEDVPATYDNPFFTIRHNTNRSDVDRFIGGLTLGYDATSWLKVNYTFGGDYWSDERKEVIAPSASIQPAGQIFRAFIKNTQLDHNLTLTATHNFSKDVASTFMVGQNLNSRVTKTLSPYGVGIGVGSWTQIGDVGTATGQESESTLRLESYFAQATTDLYDMLYLVVGLRRDQSSTFGASEPTHYYPKFSGSFAFTKLAGMENDILNFGKLRVGYGEAGREPPPYSTNSVFVGGTQFSESYGDALKTTYGSNIGFASSIALGQNHIRPEVKKEFEAGVDLNFFQDALTISTTYYDGKSVDVILNQPIPGSIGYGVQLQNAATISNKGFEVEASSHIMNIAGVLSWTGSLNWATNKNKVLDLKGSDHITIGGFQSALGVAKEGYAVGVFYGLDFIKNPDGSLFIDPASGMPVISAENSIIGDPNPDWTAGIRNTFGFLNNRLTISALIDIKQGGDVWNGTKGALVNFGIHESTVDRVDLKIIDGGYYIDNNGVVNNEGRGTFVRNTKAIVPGQTFYQGVASGFTGPASQFIEDGSYVKLREITLSYNIDNDIVASFGNVVKGIRVYAQARNLKTWTKYTGVDPETNLAGTDNLRGFDYFNNPQTRSYAFGFNLDF